MFDYPKYRTVPSTVEVVGLGVTVEPEVFVQVKKAWYRPWEWVRGTNRVRAVFTVMNAAFYIAMMKQFNRKGKR